jgi:hypothetical protein
MAAVLMIRDVYPGSQIPNPDIFHPGYRIQQQQKEEGRNKLIVLLFFVAINFTQLIKEY